MTRCGTRATFHKNIHFYANRTTFHFKINSNEKPGSIKWSHGIHACSAMSDRAVFIPYRLSNIFTTLRNLIKPKLTEELVEGQVKNHSLRLCICRQEPHVSLLLCFSTPIVSTKGRTISPSALLSAARLSVSLLLARFWFSSSLLGQAFSWLFYCLLPLGLLPQYHIPLTAKLHDWLAGCLSVCERVCAALPPKRKWDKSSGRRRCANKYVHGCLFLLNWAVCE